MSKVKIKTTNNILKTYSRNDNNNKKYKTKLPDFPSWNNSNLRDISGLLYLPDHNVSLSAKDIHLNFKSFNKANKTTFQSNNFNNHPLLYNYFDILNYSVPQDETMILETNYKMNNSIKNKINNTFQHNTKAAAKGTSKSFNSMSLLSCQSLVSFFENLLNKLNNIKVETQLLIDQNHSDLKLLFKIINNINKLESDIKTNIQQINEIINNNKFNNDLPNFSFKIKTETNNVIKKYERKFIEITHVTKCRKVKLNFNQKQKNIIFNWSNECDKVYNTCVDIYNDDNKNFKKDYKKFKLVVFSKLYPKGKTAPYDMLTDVVKEFCTNVDSCKTKMESGIITHFTMSKKNTTRQHLSLHISSPGITNKGIYTSLLDIIPNFNKLYNKFSFNRDCRLTYDSYFKKFHLCIPFYVKLVKNNENNNNQTLNNIKNMIPESKIKKMNASEKIELKSVEKEKYCALDPGEKIFQTFYAEKTCGTIGSDMRDPILTYRGIIGKYKRILKKGVNKEGKKLTNNTKKFIKKQIRLIYERIKNIVKELHNKTALFLCKNFETILIPKFGTSSMVKKNAQSEVTYVNQTSTTTRKLPKKVKFVLSMLSHYKFSSKLLYKAKEHNCQVHIVTEEYTSMTGGNCGFMSKNYTNRVKTCKNCKHKVDRDLNGARNILLKNNELVFTKKVKNSSNLSKEKNLLKNKKKQNQLE